MEVQSLFRVLIVLTVVRTITQDNIIHYLLCHCRQLLFLVNHPSHYLQLSLMTNGPILYLEPDPKVVADCDLRK